jgi:predicted transcriptional regulator
LLLADRTKRTTYDIFAEILDACQTPENKTHIMYKTNTSHRSFKKYLKQLLEMNLLQKKTKNQFNTTERGKEYLTKYNQLQNIRREATKTKS